MSCGQCEVSKRLVYRHALKSIVKKLEEKNQKFSFSKFDLSLSVHMQSAPLLPPPRTFLTIEGADMCDDIVGSN